MISTAVHVTVDHLALGAYLVRWRCSESDRGGDLVAVDDWASARWRAIADVHLPGTPAPVSELVVAALAAHSRRFAALSPTASRCS